MSAGRNKHLPRMRQQIVRIGAKMSGPPSKGQVKFKTAERAAGNKSPIGGTAEASILTL